MTISYSDFKELSIEQQKKTLEALRNEPGISELIKVWGVSRAKVYKMIHEFDLPVTSKGRAPKSNKNISTEKSLNKNQSLKSNLDEQKMPSGQYVTVATQPNVFSISLNAEGPFKNVSEKLQFLFQQNIVPDTNVRITLSIDEI